MVICSEVLVCIPAHSVDARKHLLEGPEMFKPKNIYKTVMGESVEINGYEHHVGKCENR